MMLVMGVFLESEKERNNIGNGNGNGNENEIQREINEIIRSL